jgi:hypothetical protein
MLFLIVSAVFMVLMIAVVVSSKGKPSDSFKKKGPVRFTRQVESYRLGSDGKSWKKEQDFDRICAEYARHGYRLKQRSGRDSMDLTFERIQ